MAVFVVVMVLAAAAVEVISIDASLFTPEQVTKNDSKLLSRPSFFPAITIIDYSAEENTNASLIVLDNGNDIVMDFTAGKEPQNNIIIVNQEINFTMVLNLKASVNKTWNTSITGLKVWSQGRMTWRVSHVLHHSSVTIQNILITFFKSPIAVILASLCILFALSTIVTCVCMSRRCGKTHSSAEVSASTDNSSQFVDNRTVEHQNTAFNDQDIYVNENSLYDVITLVREK